MFFRFENLFDNCNSFTGNRFGLIQRDTETNLHISIQNFAFDVGFLHQCFELLLLPDISIFCSGATNDLIPIIACEYLSANDESI